MTLEEIRRIAREIAAKQRESMLLAEQIIGALHRGPEGGAPPRTEVVGDLELIEILSEADIYAGKVDRFLRLHAILVGSLGGVQGPAFLARAIEAREAGRAAARENCACPECVKERDQAKAIADGIASKLGARP